MITLAVATISDLIIHVYTIDEKIRRRGITSIVSVYCGYQNSLIRSD